MSREIKFRVWDKVNKQMITYETTCACPDITLNGVLISHDKQSNVSYQYDLMQYTGKKDYNGRDIYAGDILKSCTTKRVLAVSWSDSKCAFVLRGDRHENLMADWDLENFEIIGDIHQHAHLMGDK